MAALPIAPSIKAPKAAAAQTLAPACIPEGRLCDCENPTRFFRGAIIPATIVKPCCQGLFPLIHFVVIGGGLLPVIVDAKLQEYQLHSIGTSDLILELVYSIADQSLSYFVPACADTQTG